MIIPPLEKGVLERDIQAETENVRFTPKGRFANGEPEGLPSRRRTPAGAMHDDGAHKGKVVCEAYPGMNPSAAHVWMSSSKTTTSILPALLEQQGLFSYDNRFTEHVPQLAPAWDDVSFKNAANMMRFTPRRGQREGSNQEATMTRAIVKSFGAARQWRDRY